MSQRRAQPGPPRKLHERVETARSRTPSSQRWLKRQLNDPYVLAARQAGYRSRAAFKLAELDDRFRLIRPTSRVVDLGAAPGGWTQVAVARAPRGAVLAVDIGAMDPVAGARQLRLDFLAPEARAAAIAALGGLVDLVLSDMAAPATGHRQTDHIRIIALAEAALDFAERALVPGGCFVAKVLQGGAVGQLLDRLKRDFTKVRHAKPLASRKESAETYVVATGFRGAPVDSDPRRD
jgi:23S rRNA (uridine2552-2'-O)-methyltransferase